MCFIVFAYRIHPSYRFIAAANRDEFYERPTAPADFWEEAPHILAGRDLREGGTWLGITRKGKFAAITNFRDPASLKADAPSRGKIVSEFLLGAESAESYVEKVSIKGHLYNGFNLLCSDQNDLFVYSNRGKIERLAAGIYGLSNHFLDSPWPKVIKGKKALKASMNLRGFALEAALFAILSDRKTAPDRTLPSTGVGLEKERMLSPIFIESPGYGTRSSTVLMIAKNNRVKLIEKGIDGKPQPWIESRFSFLLNGGKE
jgi:uncharacterized protein with NRDE domain